jgi:urease accessory protein
VAHPANSPSTPTARDDWLLWQLIDSAFPTGGFAHSGGVEAAWQHGLLVDGDALRTFVADALRQAASAAVPVALAVWQDPSTFSRWDAFYDVTVSNHVANRASRAQGRALLATAADTFDLPVLRDAAAAARAAKTVSHLPAAFGLTAAALHVPPESTAGAFLFATARSCVSSAVRVGLVGPLEGQRIQASVAGDVAAAITLAARTPPEAVAQTTFMADLMQGTQDRLYSRLFQS